MMLRQRVMHMWRTGQYIKPADSGFHPRQIYVPGVQGAVYRPRDLSTLFQDSAGTTPVTAIEQPVGRMLDISGNGNHAFQTTPGKRPVVSRRVNLLTKTEVLTDSVYVKNNTSVDEFTGSKPFSSRAYAVTSAATAAATNLRLASLYGFGSISLRVKSAGVRYVVLSANAFTVYSTTFDLVAGAVTQNSTNYVGSSSTITPIGDGWFEITWKFGAEFNNFRVNIAFSSSPTENHAATTFAGDGVSGLLLAAPNALSTVDAHLPYQWVNTATDYDDNAFKFPTYLRCDGAATAMQTNAIDFTGTDKMTVWAGITKLSDDAAGIVCELSANLSINSGVFSLLAPVTGSTYGFYSKGTVLAGAVTGAGRIAPHSSVLTGIGDISGDRATLRELSVQTVQTTTDQGTGNYGNHPLHIGARGGTLSYLNGRLYSLIVAGAQMTPEQLAASEAWTAAEMMVPA